MAGNTLCPITQHIDMKSGAAIEGHLTNGAIIASSNGQVDLDVQVNGKTLPVGAANKVQLLTDLACYLLGNQP